MSRIHGRPFGTDPAQGSVCRRRCARRGRKGAALVEAALVMPLLMLVLVFLIDFSRAYVVAKAIDNAANQGAMTASMNPMTGTSSAAWVARVEQTVRLSLAGYGWYDPNDLTVTVPVPTIGNGMIDANGYRWVQVNVRYDSDFMLTLPGLPETYTIARTVRMDQIR